MMGCDTIGNDLSLIDYYQYIIFQLQPNQPPLRAPSYERHSLHPPPLSIPESTQQTQPQQTYKESKNIEKKKKR